VEIGQNGLHGVMSVETVYVESFCNHGSAHAS
jgi:hypothetical protein